VGFEPVITYARRVSHRARDDGGGDDGQGVDEIYATKSAADRILNSVNRRLSIQFEPYRASMTIKYGIGFGAVVMMASY
jgi:hypothetical protein